MSNRIQAPVRTVSVGLKDWLQDVELLVKFRLSGFVVFSSVVAYAIAAGDQFSFSALVLLICGGCGITFAANALNEILEADYDALMPRTANRPLAAKRWSISSALVFAGFSSLIGITLLAILNPLTSFLGTLSLVSYAFIYTPLKRYSPAAVFVGAFPGALPVMIGMIAHDGGITQEAFFLFAVQFIWQFPHFWAIGFVSFEQYRGAGYKLLSQEGDEIDPRLGKQTLIYTCLLIPVLIAGLAAGLINWIGFIAMILLSGYFIYKAWAFYKSFNKDTARSLMFSSFIFLPLALIVLWLTMNV